VYDNSMKMNAELSAADAMRAELMQVQGEIEKLNAERKNLIAKVQMLTQVMERASAELQWALAIKAEIEAMKQEVQHKLGNALIYKDAIEYEKKEYVDNYEQGQLLEKNLILMARKVEKLRLEVANAVKRAGEGEAAGNQGTCVTFFLQLTDQSCSKNLVL
ncbi:protein FLX-like 1, partial [Dendrobium catenatum]|uniref:protein FLX-like 1 n=1 Tax=Dendrobium catenatum TaxID=906689 RepID=UPI00109F8243